MESPQSETGKKKKGIRNPFRRKNKSEDDGSESDDSGTLSAPGLHYAKRARGRDRDRARSSSPSRDRSRSRSVTRAIAGMLKKGAKSIRTIKTRKNKQKGEDGEEKAKQNEKSSELSQDKSDKPLDTEDSQSLQGSEGSMSLGGNSKKKKKKKSSKENDDGMNASSGSFDLSVKSESGKKKKKKKKKKADSEDVDDASVSTSKSKSRRKKDKKDSDKTKSPKSKKKKKKIKVKDEFNVELEAVKDTLETKKKRMQLADELRTSFKGGLNISNHPNAGENNENQTEEERIIDPLKPISSGSLHLKANEMAASSHQKNNGEHAEKMAEVKEDSDEEDEEESTGDEMAVKEKKDGLFLSKEEIEKQKADAEKLEESLANAREEIESKEKELAEAREKLMSVQKKLESKEEESEAAKAESSELMKQLNETEKESEENAKTLKRIKNDAKSKDETINLLEEEIESNAQKIASLQKSAKSQQQLVETLEKRLNESDVNGDNVESKSNEDSEAFEEMRKRVEEVDSREKDLEERENRIKMAEEEEEAKRLKFEELEKELLEKEEDLNGLSGVKDMDEVYATLRELREIKTKNDAERDALESERTELDEAKEKAERDVQLLTDMSEEKRQSVSAEEKDQEILKLREECNRLKDENEDFAKQIQESGGSGANQEDVDDRLRMLEEENDELRRKLEEAEEITSKNYNSSQGELDPNMLAKVEKEWEDKLRKKDATIIGLEDALEELSRTIDSGDTEGYTKELIQELTDLKQRAGNIGELEEDLNEAVMSLKAKELEADELRENLQDLKFEVGNRKAEDSLVSNARLKQLEFELEHTKKELDAATTGKYTDRLKKEIRILKDGQNDFKKKLRKEKSDSMTKLKRKDESIQFMQKELAKMKREMDRLQLKEKQMKDSYPLVGDEATKKMIQDLEDEIEHWRTVNCELEDEVVTLKSEATEWKDKAQRARVVEGFDDDASIGSLSKDHTAMSGFSAFSMGSLNRSGGFDPDDIPDDQSTASQRAMRAVGGLFSKLGGTAPPPNKPNDPYGMNLYD